MTNKPENKKRLNLNRRKLIRSQRKSQLEMSEFINAFFRIELNALMNNYAVENVSFGEIKPNEKIPFDKYISDLELPQSPAYQFRTEVEGFAITDEETIVNQDIDFFMKDCFRTNINTIFMDSSLKDAMDYDTEGTICFKHEIYDFILSLFPLYKDILTTEVEYGGFDLLLPFPDRFARADCFQQFSKLLIDIKVRNLQIGQCIDKYLKNLSFIPYYVKRLFEVKKNRYILTNNDIESLDYKLAVLSTINYINPEHIKLFELKAQRFEESKRSCI